MNEPRKEICPNCHQEIDPDYCHCGSPIESHHWQDGHAPIPMGCICGYAKTDEDDEQA